MTDIVEGSDDVGFIPSPDFPYKMDPEIKAKWIAALRSGKYKQGQNAMRIVAPDGDCFCCLGVLCDVIDPNAWNAESFAGLAGRLRGWAFDGIRAYTAIPPNKVLESYASWKLSDLNDQQKFTFAEIADYIDATL